MKSADSTDSRRSPLERRILGVVIALFLILLVVTLVRTAWLCDDAYITYRTIDNLQAGHGLTWNVGERVQPHTHPLWMLLLAFTTWITGELYGTVIGVGITLTLVAVAFTIRTVGFGWGGVTTLAVLCFSRSFIDFSTGGLEDPLSHCLLAVFLWLTFRPAEDLHEKSRVTALALVVGLALTTRMDTLLFYLPALLTLFRPSAGLRGLKPFAIGFAPFVLWELFSVIYFGFPFPNVAYTKLGIEIPAGEVAQQGLAYLRNSFHNDPLTLSAIAAGVTLTVLRRAPRSLPIAIGTLLYLVYVVRVGGDFMSGRMVSLPLFAAATLLGRYAATLSWGPAMLLPDLAVFLGILAPYPTIATGADFAPPERLLDAADTNGIADERMVYYGATGLLSERRLEFVRKEGKPGMPAHSWAVKGLEASRKPPAVMTRSTIGYFSYFAGPKVYVVDANALTDPLLARIPRLIEHKTRNERTWRIGHFTRKLPKGYVQTLKTGGDKFAHRGLAEYYAVLQRVVTGPLFTAERWRAIWKLNTGQHDHLIDAYVESLD